MSSNHKAIFIRSFFPPLAFIALIWAIKLVEVLTNLDFGTLGILPRELEGSIGILTAPLIHSDFSHLISNTFPLLLLGTASFYFYPKKAPQIIIMIYLLTGAWVWLSARDGAYHIGASGVVYGLVLFHLVIGIIRRDPASLAISLAILFLYGGMIYGIFPGKKSISWESHLMGAVAGLFTAFYFKDKLVLAHRKSSNTSLSEEIDFQYIYKSEAQNELDESFFYEVKDKEKPTEEL